MASRAAWGVPWHREMPESAAPLLHVADLRIETARGWDIVGDITFDLRAGEVLALVGESGCGKTSTALALLGHARPGTRISSGSVLLDGENLLELPDVELRRIRGTRVAYVPQNPSAALNPRIRLLRQIAEVLEVHGTRGRAADESVLELLARVNLSTDAAFLRRYPFELSGGQQQRVVIAMALACRPRVVVLDEPTTGLDVTTQARVLALLRALSRETSVAFVYVTHDLAVVDNLADRVAVMYAGRIVELGDRERIFLRPIHPYTNLLLASVPRLARPNDLIGIPGTAPQPGRRPSGCAFAPRCPLASPQCREAFPPVSIVARRHQVRCWRSGEMGQVVPGSRRRPAAAESAQPPLLQVEKLCATYGRGSRETAVLHDVSFHIGTGECVALVGESGSGKTTAGRAIAGLHPPRSGRITLRGESLAARAVERTREERRSLQLVFQNPDRSLNPAETVEQSLLRPIRLFTRDGERGSETQRVRELLERVRLDRAVRRRYPREISGGEKQRVAIARAIAAEPELLICDEITSALDVSIQAAIVSLLGELRRDGLAMLFITHNLALVNAIADRVIVLESGHIREEGETHEVIRHPSHAYTRELINAAPDILERDEENLPVAEEWPPTDPRPIP